MYSFIEIGTLMQSLTAKDVQVCGNIPLLLPL